MCATGGKLTDGSAAQRLQKIRKSGRSHVALRWPHPATRDGRKADPRQCSIYPACMMQERAI